MLGVHLIEIQEDMCTRENITSSIALHRIIKPPFELMVALSHAHQGNIARAFVASLSQWMANWSSFPGCGNAPSRSPCRVLECSMRCALQNWQRLFVAIKDADHPRRQFLLQAGKVAGYACADRGSAPSDPPARSPAPPCIAPSAALTVQHSPDSSPADNEEEHG